MVHRSCVEWMCSLKNIHHSHSFLIDSQEASRLSLTTISLAFHACIHMIANVEWHEQGLKDSLG